MATILSNGRVTLRAGKPRSRPGHRFGALVWTIAFAISLAAAALAVCGLGGTRWSSAPAFAQESQRIAGSPAAADQAAVVDFSEAARAEAAGPSPGGFRRSFHRPLPRLHPEGGRAEQLGQGEQAPSANHRHARHGAEVSFGGTNDNGTIIPPDTMGAVGPNNVVETLNNNFQIFTRAGALISSVTLTGFWSKLSIGEAFDPRITFDPFNGRWIVSAGANPGSATSAILVGVSQTSDPTGAWNLYKVNADATGTLWVDFPTLGFNKNWIAVQANLFTVSANSFVNSTIYLFDKADLYAAGAGSYTVIQETSGFTDCPATTYDNTLDTLYLAESWSGAQGTLRISTVSGPIGSEVLSPGVAFPQGSQGWQSFPPTTNFAPQAGSTQKIDTDDDRLIASVYRNGALWASHTAYLPASGTPTRTAAQWWEVDLTAGHLGNVLQFGRVDDPSGQLFFAYPTLAVNLNDDVLLGYSQFSASSYASGAYSFRYGTDPVNTMEPTTVLKAGLAPYYKDFGTGDNRWGDYSATVVDPTNDTDLWTLQEYAGTSNYWGTWWGSVTPSSASATPTPTPSATATPAATFTPTPTPTATPTAVATPTPTPSATPTPTPLTITTTSLPSGRVGVSYSATINVKGGVPPYSFSVTSGSLPPGLALATATGTVSGTPSASGKWSFQVTVTDSAGAKASKKYLLKISLL